MTYRKPTGLWIAHYAAMYDDPRTQAAADYLVDHRVPRYVAVQVVVTAWCRLHVHALGEGNTGETGHLSDRRFAEVAWPESADAPRALGRREKIGALLREALKQVPHGHDEGLLTCAVPVENGGCPDQPLQGAGSDLASPEALVGWEELHRKILGDRRRQPRTPSQSGGSRAPAVRAPPGGRDVAAATSHSPQKKEDPPKPPVAEVPPSVPLQEPPSAAPPEGISPAPAGAAAARRAPGAGDGDSGSIDRTRGIVLTADANLKEQKRNGLDTTCHSGEHYLFRVARADVALRDQLIGDVGRKPAPGALLAAAAPERFESLVRRVHKRFGRFPRLTNPGAYIRTALASEWQDLLGQLADEETERRSRDRGLEEGR